MENQNHSNEISSKNKEIKIESNSLDMNLSNSIPKKDTNTIDIQKKSSNNSTQSPSTQKKPAKPVKPPKLEDKPFKEFVCSHLIPGLKLSIENKGTIVSDIKLIEGKRPVVGGNCWMIYCEIREQRRFWLCFSQDKIISDKTILLAESNSEPSIVESFLIDEKKITLPLLISRVLQRLNGQKWIGIN